MEPLKCQDRTTDVEAGLTGFVYSEAQHLVSYSLPGYCFECHAKTTWNPSHHHESPKWEHDCLHQMSPKVYNKSAFTIGNFGA